MGKIIKKGELGAKTARMLSAVLAGNISGLLIGVATIVIVARLLGPLGYGAYTIGISYYLLIDAAMQFGLTKYVSREIAVYVHKGDDKGLHTALSSSYYLTILISAILTAIGIIASIFVAGIYANTGINVNTLIIASFVMLVAMPFNTSVGALVGFGRSKLVIVSSLLENAVQLVASFGLILIGAGFNGAIAGIVIGYTFGFGFAYVQVARIASRNARFRMRFSLKELKRAWHFCVPIAVTNALNNGVGYFATFILGIFVSVYVIGNYGVAMRFSTLLSVVAGSVPIAILPALSIVMSGRKARKTAKKDDGAEQAYRKTIFYSLAAMLPLVVFLGVFSKPLVAFFVTKSYALAPLYVSAISLGIMLGLIGQYAASIIIAGGHTRKLMKYTAISAFAQLASMLVLVPLIGAIGAIISVFVIGGIVSTLVIVIGIGNIYQMRLSYAGICKVVLAAVFLAAVLAAGYLIKSNLIEIIYGIAATLVLYPVFLSAVRAIGVAELNELEGIAKRSNVIRTMSGFIISYFRFLTDKLA